MLFEFRLPFLAVAGNKLTHEPSAAGLTDVMTQQQNQHHLKLLAVTSRLINTFYLKEKDSR